MYLETEPRQILGFFDVWPLIASPPKTLFSTNSFHIWAIFCWIVLVLVLLHLMSNSIGCLCGPLKLAIYLNSANL